MTTRRPAGSSPARRPLRRDDVIRETLLLIDAEGVDALTMRRVADRMGVYPTALYWHTGNKAALIAAVCELVMSDIDLPPIDGPPWDEWLRAMAVAARRTLHAHPNIAPVLGSQLQVTTSSFPLAEQVLAVLGRAGFADERLAQAYNSTIGFMFGWLFGELSAEPPDAAADWPTNFARQLRSIDPEVAPTLAQNLPVLANRAFMLRWEPGARKPMDGSFEFAVEVLLAGLRAQSQQNG